MLTSKRMSGEDAPFERRVSVQRLWQRRQRQAVLFAQVLDESRVDERLVVSHPNSPPVTALALQLDWDEQQRCATLHVGTLRFEVPQKAQC